MQHFWVYPCHGRKCLRRVLYGSAFQSSVCAIAQLTLSAILCPPKNHLTQTEAKLSARLFCLSILANVVSHRPFEKQGLRNLPHALAGVGCTARDRAGQLWELPCSSWQSWSTWLLCGCDTRKLLSFDMRKGPVSLGGGLPLSLPPLFMYVVHYSVPYQCWLCKLW